MRGSEVLGLLGSRKGGEGACPSKGQEELTLPVRSKAMLCPGVVIGSGVGLGLVLGLL